MSGEEFHGPGAVILDCLGASAVWLAAWAANLIPVLFRETDLGRCGGRQIQMAVPILVDNSVRLVQRTIHRAEACCVARPVALRDQLVIVTVLGQWQRPPVELALLRLACTLILIPGPLCIA